MIKAASTRLINAFDEFEKASGFSINYDKTSVYRIGSLANSSAKLYCQKPLNWTNDGINVLGVNIHSDINTVYVRNYNH